MFNKIYTKLIVICVLFSVSSLLYCAVPSDNGQGWGQVDQAETTPQKLQTFLQEKTHAEQELNAKLLQVTKSSEFDAQQKKKALAILLDSKASIDAEDLYGNTVLYQAIECASSKRGTDNSVIQFLIAQKAPLNGDKKCYNVPLECAIRYAKSSVVNMLVQAKADVNARGGLPLCTLTHRESGPIDNMAVAMFNMLAQNNLDVDARIVYGGSINTKSCAPVCLANATADCGSYAKKKLISCLFVHGASPWCPKSSCKTAPDSFGPELLVVHEKWKSGATSAVMVHIPIKAVVNNIVMSYCFSSFKKRS